MKYENNTVSAVFIKRLNRFAAEVELKGETVCVHVKNTGRLGELLLPGSAVTLCDSCNPERKYRYDLISVYKEESGWVNIDSQASNAVFHEWLKTRSYPFTDAELIKPEYVHGDSRVDFYLEAPGRRILIEVKGCTLVKNGKGCFPDAPTERGVKHLNALARAASEGYECYVAFVIAVPGITEVVPNDEIHPEFGTALESARKSGVKVLFMQCSVTENEITITNGLLQ